MKGHSKDLERFQWKVPTDRNTDCTDGAAIGGFSQLLDNRCTHSAFPSVWWATGTFEIPAAPKKIGVSSKFNTLAPIGSTDQKNDIKPTKGGVLIFILVFVAHVHTTCTKYLVLLHGLTGARIWRYSKLPITTVITICSYMVSPRLQSKLDRRIWSITLIIWL